MATPRIEQLQKLLAEDQTNKLARYGLAMEYIQQGECEQAVAEFETVLRADQGYSAAYFHGGQALEKLGRVEQAERHAVPPAPCAGSVQRTRIWRRQ